MILFGAELFRQLENIGVTDDQNTMQDKVQSPPTASKTFIAYVLYSITHTCTSYV